jgi:hypothetical protein
MTARKLKRMYWVFGIFTALIAISMVVRCLIIANLDFTEGLVIGYSAVSAVIYLSILSVILLTAIKVLKIKITGAHVIKLKTCQLISISLYVILIMLGALFEILVFIKSQDLVMQDSPIFTESEVVSKLTNINHLFLAYICI